MLRKPVYISMFLIAIVFCGTGSLYAQSSPPLPEALEALESDDNATVTSKRLPFALLNATYYVFEPVGMTTPTTGFVFYPGGLVDARAYAPFLREIAEAGYTVILVPMPFDLAVFGWKRATTVMKDYPAIEKWALGGHSFGGVMSCRYGGTFTDNIDGVVMWASYPSEYFRIDDTDLKCISIYGEKDALSDLDEIEESREHLPADTEFVEIKGGNHTQFGWYGETPDQLQEGDNPADISREQQQEEVVKATIGFLEEL